MIAGAMLTWGFVIPGLIVGSIFGIIAYSLYFFGHKADKETVKLIYSLMPEDHTYIDVAQTPPKALKKINKLWVKFSNGRFGFSVQQKIWTKILKVYHSSGNRYWIDKSVYEYFIDSVGWSRESDCIYPTSSHHHLLPSN